MESFKPYWKVVVVGLMLVTMMIGGVYWYYDRALIDILPPSQIEQETQEQKVTNKNLLLPAELGTDFDPSHTTAVFRVLEMNGEANEALVQYFWPKVKAETKVRTGVDCVIYGNRIIDEGEGNPRIVGKSELIKTMRETRVENMMLYSKCSDMSCSKLVGVCELVIGEGVGSGT